MPGEERGVQGPDGGGVKPVARVEIGREPAGSSAAASQVVNAGYSALVLTRTPVGSVLIRPISSGTTGVAAAVTSGSGSAADRVSPSCWMVEGYDEAYQR